MEKILNTKIKNGDTTIKIPDSIKAFIRKQNFDNDDLTIIVDLLLKELFLQYEQGYSDGCNKLNNKNSDDDLKNNDSDAIDLLRRLRDEDFRPED